jgi:hypothetical protein
MDPGLRTKANLLLTAAVCGVLTAVAYLRPGSNHVPITRSDTQPADAAPQRAVAVNVERTPLGEYADAPASPIAAQVPITLTAQAIQLMAKYPDHSVHQDFLVTDQAFIAESVDLQWSRGMEADILGEIARISRGQLVTVDVECRTTMCRIQLSERGDLGDARPEERAPVFFELVTKHAIGSPKVSLLGTDGTTTSLAYVRRPSEE